MTRADWYASAEPRCARCFRTDRRLVLHHVTYRQHVVREGGDVWDPRNSLSLCADSCHPNHHAGGSGRVLLSSLRDENFVFAAELFGAPAAFEWLRRRYAGFDRRHDLLLEEDQLDLGIAA